MSGLIVYLLAGVLWCVFAANMQLKVHPDANFKLYRAIVVLVLNFMFWPVGMLMASCNLISGKHDKYFR